MERLDALRGIACMVRQDIRRQVHKMVDEGWDPYGAACATVDWWVTTLLGDAVDGARDVLRELDQ